MKVELTNETVFSFEGPNLCLLGNEYDFRLLAESIIELTNIGKPTVIELNESIFLDFENKQTRIFFSSKTDAFSLGVFNTEGDLLFELDYKIWERIFKSFVLMSWHKRTYYLNSDENIFQEYQLEQECNFICSSSF